MKYSLGRNVFGLAAIGFGLCAFAWHDITNWHQLKALRDLPYRDGLTYIVAAIEILGGLAVQWPRATRAGAIALGGVYLVFVLVTVPIVFKQPLIYNSYGNFFEQFSLLCGAMILYASSGMLAVRSARLAQFGYYGFGVCVISFALEQLFYLPPTASLVPKWIPPGQMFWAIATTAAFALAGIAFLTGIKARLAARMTTAMLVGFGLLVWMPILFAAPHDFSNWSESVLTFAIAGSAWIVADLRAAGTPK